MKAKKKFKVFKNRYDEYTVINTTTKRMPSGDLSFNTAKKANKMINWLNKNTKSTIRAMDSFAKKLK